MTTTVTMRSECVGNSVGNGDGPYVGNTEGTGVGIGEGANVGNALGNGLGAIDGKGVGAMDKVETSINFTSFREIFRACTSTLRF